MTEKLKIKNNRSVFRNGRTTSVFVNNDYFKRVERATLVECPGCKLKFPKRGMYGDDFCCNTCRENSRRKII